MTPAEFKTLRESLNISGVQLATFFGMKSPRSIWFWEAGAKYHAVPEFASTTLLDLCREIEAGAAGIVKGWPPKSRKPLKLLRYPTDDALRLAEPGAYMGIATAHAAMIGRAYMSLFAAGAAVTIEWAPPAAVTVAP